MSPRAQRIEFALRQLGRAAAAHAERRRRRRQRLAGRGQPLRFALVEQRCDLIRIELRLLLLLLLLLSLGLFRLGLLARLFLLQRLGDRIDLGGFFSGFCSGAASAPVAAAGGGSDAAVLTSCFLAIFATASSAGLGSPIFSTGGLVSADLLGVLDALGEFGELLVRDDVDRQRIGRRGLERSRRKRDQPPQQQGGVRERRNGQTCLHLRRFHEPCSTSVTSATRRKPAADRRPITFITVPYSTLRSPRT